MVLHIIQQVQQLVVVGPVARLARQLVHVRRPAGGLDGGDAHWVDGPKVAGPPLLGRGVDYVGFAEGTDLSRDGFLLLEEHAAGFEVADARHHGALHDGAAFVILDVAHPAGLLESDFFGEALLFEVADGVVVGVCEEVLDWGRSFDVVFEVGHEMRPVAFYLLVRGDGAEDDFGELTAVERTICDTSFAKLVQELVRLKLT